MGQLHRHITNMHQTSLTGIQKIKWVRLNLILHANVEAPRGPRQQLTGISIIITFSIE